MNARDRATVSAARPAVELELGRIVRSESFKGSARHQRLLQHLVQRTLAGETRALKESVLAVELFDRAARSYDPSRDTIVRVEARRLRQRLTRYYETEGSDSPLRIELPVGSYIPAFKRRDGRSGEPSRLARDLVERGNHFLREGREPSLRKAIERFEAAIREDADNALAHLGAARAWMNLVAELYEPPLPWVDHATEALQRALDLDPLNPESLTLMGATLHRYHFDWTAARQHFERAISLAPELAFAHLGYGAHLLLAGELDRAEEALQKARALDPHYLNARWHMAALQVARRDFDEMRREVEAILDLMPTHLPARHMLGMADLFEGRVDAALARYRELDDEAPQHPIGLVGMAQALGLSGDQAGVDRMLERLKQRFAGRYVSPYQLALVAWRRGQRDAVFALLDEAAATRDSNTLFAASDPSWDGLRDDPRFGAFLNRHGLAIHR